MNHALRLVLRALVGAAFALPTVVAAEAAAPSAAQPVESPDAASAAVLPSPTFGPAAAAEVAPALPFAELPNFHRVDEKLYRGGEPGPGGLERLKAMGIETVLDLRHERRKIRAERAAAEAIGLRYVSLPMYGLARPNDAKVARALAVIDDPANGAVFVHCERGSDRTGVIVACRRVAHAKWSAQRAIQEAMGHGMYWFELAKRSFVRDFSARIGG